MNPPGQSACSLQSEVLQVNCITNESMAAAGELQMSEYLCSSGDTVAAKDALCRALDKLKQIQQNLPGIIQALEAKKAAL